jgi:hypothetical protein
MSSETNPATGCPICGSSSAAKSEGWHSGQWGLSAFMVGALVIVMMPLGIGLMFGSMVGAYGNGDLKSSDLDLGILVTELLVGGTCLLAVFSLLFGIIGLLTGLYRKQAIGLAAGGTVTGVVAIVMAIILAMVAAGCIEWARDYQKRRFSGSWPPPMRKL